MMARNLLTSSLTVTAHFAFLEAPWSRARDANGPIECSYCRNFARNSSNGILTDKAMPRRAFTRAVLYSSGSRACKWFRHLCKPSSSIITCWYSDAAPPASLSALHIFTISPADVNLLYPLQLDPFFGGYIPPAARKSPTLKPNAGATIVI